MARVRFLRDENTLRHIGDTRENGASLHRRKKARANNVDWQRALALTQSGMVRINA